MLKLPRALTLAPLEIWETSLDNQVVLYRPQSPVCYTYEKFRHPQVPAIDCVEKRGPASEVGSVRISILPEKILHHLYV